MKGNENILSGNRYFFPFEVNFTFPNTQLQLMLINALAPCVCIWHGLGKQRRSGGASQLPRMITNIPKQYARTKANLLFGIGNEWMTQLASFVPFWDNDDGSDDLGDQVEIMTSVARCRCLILHRSSCQVRISSVRDDNIDSGMGFPIERCGMRVCRWHEWLRATFCYS